jgi:hypothetical protein
MNSSPTVDVVDAAVLLSLIPRAFARTPTAPAAAGRLTRRIITDIREGLRYLWHQRLVRTLTLLAFGLNLTGGAVVGLLVVYGVRALGLGRHDSRLGLLYTVGAAGGLVATLLVPRVSRWWGRERELARSPIAINPPAAPAPDQPVRAGSAHQCPRALPAITSVVQLAVR